MKIVIPGGSGQVGSFLARHFLQAGHEVTVLSRTTRPSPWKVALWDGETPGPWVQELEGTDVLINLAGQSVNCRYTARNRCILWASRTRSVRVLGRALERLKQPPRLWVQAGTATIYAHRYDAPQDEATGIMGGLEAGAPDTWRFSIDVAQAWEGEFNLIHTPKTRKVILRSAMTMSPDTGGVFDYLLHLVRFGLGGPVAGGQQYMSWIHDVDFIRTLEHIIAHEELAGPINIAAPHPLPQKDFMKILRDTWGIKFGMPVTRWMMEIGAFLLRTESELILKSRRVIPARLLESGFVFQYPHWDKAAANLCQRWKA